MKRRVVYLSLVLAGGGMGLAAVFGGAHSNAMSAAGAIGDEAAYLERGLVAGAAAFFTDGVPTCDSGFARCYVQQAVDTSALMTASSNIRAASTGVIGISELGLNLSRTCRGTVTFRDGRSLPVIYTITPRGFHDYVVTTMAKGQIKS